MDLKYDNMELQPLIDLAKTIEDLSRQLMSSELWKYLTRQQALISYAYEPVLSPTPDVFRRDCRVNAVTKAVLDECMISIKRRGYSYIKDAVCIISDLNTYDIIMNKDIYQMLADKYGVKGTDIIEHNIRNALKAAYEQYLRGEHAGSSPLDNFAGKPTSKKLLLHLAKEVNSRLSNET